LHRTCGRINTGCNVAHRPKGTSLYHVVDTTAMRCDADTIVYLMPHLITPRVTAVPLATPARITAGCKIPLSITGTFTRGPLFTQHCLCAMPFACSVCALVHSGLGMDAASPPGLNGRHPQPSPPKVRVRLRFLSCISHTGRGCIFNYGYFCNSELSFAPCESAHRRCGHRGMWQVQEQWLAFLNATITRRQPLWKISHAAGGRLRYGVRPLRLRTR
jgi:hypothetical protein